MTTLQSCILALLFLLCAVVIAPAAYALFFGCFAVATTWGLYSIALWAGRGRITADGLVWGRQ